MTIAGARDMQTLPQDLGQRIVEAARLAAAIHLQAAAREVPNFGRRMRIGGAGPVPIGGADQTFGGADLKAGGAGLNPVTDDAGDCSGVQAQLIAEAKLIADEPAEPREPADAWPASGPSARIPFVQGHPSPRAGRGEAA